MAGSLRPTVGIALIAVDRSMKVHRFLAHPMTMVGSRRAAPIVSDLTNVAYSPWVDVDVGVLSLEGREKTRHVYDLAVLCSGLTRARCFLDQRSLTYTNRSQIAFTQAYPGTYDELVVFVAGRQLVLVRSKLNQVVVLGMTGTISFEPGALTLNGPVFFNLPSYYEIEEEP